MKEMCLECYGTGKIKCQACVGTGVMPNVSLLGEDCLKCGGSGIEWRQLCRGTGFIEGRSEVSEVDFLPAQPLPGLIVVCRN